MAKRLGNEDRQTIDLLLDSAARSQSGGVSLQGIASNARVSAAERVLSLLETLPSEEPPADLLERTMRRIDRSSPRRDHAGMTAPTFTSDQPHA